MIRVFIAAVVAAFGLASYAAATLLWDRRVIFRRWLGKQTNQPGPASTGMFAGVLGGLLVLGTVLILGSCMGLVVL